MSGQPPDFDALSAPLRGLRVLDISQGLAGPYCASILQRQGADVIKVEPPNGDWSRKLGVTVGDASTTFLAYNAGKRGICVDAGQAEGREIVRTLAARADVFVQNFRPGVVKRLGIDYDAVASKAPNLIYVSISGFGPHGPDVDLPATDSVLQALTGMMHLNQAAGRPRRFGLLVADIATAIYSAQAVTASLYRRAVSGAGGHIEISLLQACAAFQALAIMEHAVDASALSRAPSAPGGVYRTADGFISMSCLNDAMFQRICTALDRSVWLSDDRWATNDRRLKNVDAINRAVEEALASQPSAHWIERLRRFDVLHARVNDYDAFRQHKQTQASKVFTTLHHPQAGILPDVRHPLEQGNSRCPAPELGEHTKAILKECGYADTEIDRLIAGKAVRAGSASQG